MENLINTCISTTGGDLESLAGYSHIIPIVLSLSLAIFIFFKAKFNLFSKIFLSFVVSFCLWLVGDVIIWITNDYHLVYSLWSILVYIELIFFILGLYFIITFVHEKDAKWYVKTVFIVLLVIPFLITVLGYSVEGFYQSICEASNNVFLDNYKLVVESGIGLTMLLYLIRAFFRKQNYSDRKADIIVISSILLFLTVFGATEYISSITGIYEYNLYSLFILPVFLITIIYAVFELDIFRFNILGTHYLVVGLVILSGGQLFFISTTTDKFLTILTVVLTLGLSIILFRNLKKESDQRIHIEKLSVELAESKSRVEDINTKLESANEKLKGLDKLKSEFLSLAAHQLRSPLTAMKGYASMVVEGSYGEINPQVKDAVGRIFQSSQNLAKVVEDLLDVSKIEQGGMKFVMEPFSLIEIARDMEKDLSITAEKRGLKMQFESDAEEVCVINGDKEKLRQVVLNFIDNSIKYTKEGTISVSVKRVGDKVQFRVKDTGMGMTPEIKASLFQKFARGDGARMNTTGSGLGLYLAKEIVSAHKGEVMVDSEGPGKGSTFGMDLDAIK